MFLPLITREELNVELLGQVHQLTLATVLEIYKGNLRYWICKRKRSFGRLMLIIKLSTVSMELDPWEMVTDLVKLSVEEEMGP